MNERFECFAKISTFSTFISSFLQAIVNIVVAFANRQVLLGMTFKHYNKSFELFLLKKIM